MVLRPFGDKKPSVAEGVFVDESALVIGDVRLLEGVSVWPGVVLRADDDYIEIGRGSAIMDVAFAEAPKGRPVVVGDRCIVSHAARLHGCSIGSESLVGIGAIILDGAVLGQRSIAAAGSVLTPGTRIPPESLVMGAPAKVIRQTTSHDFSYLASELKALERKARIYRLGK
jgi:carbonic anhydrase/acetyltransferase-like protein (isoleucine patch superfamily)